MIQYATALVFNFRRHGLLDARFRGHDKQPDGGEEEPAPAPHPQIRFERQRFVKRAHVQARFHAEVPFSRLDGPQLAFFPAGVPYWRLKVFPSQRMTSAMPSGPSSRSAMETELSKLSSPRSFLVRM